MLKIKTQIRKPETWMFETRAKKLSNCPCFKKLSGRMIRHDDLEENVEEIECIKH